MNQEDIENMREQVNTNLAGLFAMVDVNGDGFIEKEELRIKMDEGFEPLPHSFADWMDKEKQISQFFKLAYKNDDGMVSKDELMAILNKLSERLAADE